MSLPLESEPPPMGASVLPRSALQWLKFFGPGAVLASLTIGAGELIFSTRAGSLFGYKLLWFFVVVLFFKWLLAYSTARHMALTGAHPFQRWMGMPGPRGWFPLIFLLLAVVSFPVWVAFHAGTVGTLLAALTGSKAAFGGGGHFIWGMGVLAVVLSLSMAGGYKTLENAQIAIVAVMLLSVVAAFVMIQPDWGEFLNGLLIPQAVHYPEWAALHPELRSRPVWVETVTYVGVIGGSAYDYLAYVSYVREKNWGRAGAGVATPAELLQVEADPAHPSRQWLRPVLLDSLLSFAAVLVFTAVFTACGAMILRPLQQIPAGGDLLTLQSQFLTSLYPGLKHLYWAGAFLAVFGTLYGTIEVAPAVLRELVFAFQPALAGRKERAIRLLAVLWVGGGGFAVLAASLAYVGMGRSGNPPALIAILTPANLFTGVLACGCICLLATWADRKHLPPKLRLPPALMVLNVAGGLFFLLLGLKSYWDYDSVFSWVLLGATVLLGIGGALLVERRRARSEAPYRASPQ